MATIQIRVDDSIKTAADSLFADLGLDTSTAVRMFISAALEHDGIPFKVKRSIRKISNAELDKQIVNAIKSKNINKIKLDADENGNIVIDKELHPEIYDWAVNG